MNFTFGKRLSAFTCQLTLGLIALIASLGGCHRFSRISDDACETDCPEHAKVCRHPTMASLACDLDHLECHIDRFGSVVVQHPSVWGQARLTKHREEFEQIMEQDLCKFEKTLQGALSRSDNAYFANAQALSMAASGAVAMKSQRLEPNNTSVNLAPITVVEAQTENPVVLGGSSARLAVPLEFKTMGAQGIMLEPSVILNQKARYLNHLHELRRINEGDDTADSPGYALNLIRVPVSILPGSHTQEGYGAEITMTLKPHLSDELLPATFRNLVMNDLLEIVGVPLTQFLNDDEQFARLKLQETAIPVVLQKTNAVNKGQAMQMLQNRTLVPKGDDQGAKAVYDEIYNSFSDSQKRSVPSKDKLPEILQAKPKFRFAFSSSKLRQARRPFPPSQIIEVFGREESTTVALRAFDTLRRDPTNKCWIHYPDVQSYLREELAAAYRLLAEPRHGSLWRFCSPELVTAIHTRNALSIEASHSEFNQEVELAVVKSNNAEPNGKQFSAESDVTACLAWAIIVESALLTEQLTNDMKEAAAARNCPCPAEGWHDYYMPSPSLEARAAFNRYVECRWPIIVFALDPVTDQQNIADSFSSRREMQLAMSMAFVSGNISAKKMMKYARRLELEAETIALNNTVTGFSHGNETFGWRFQPRFQTPDTESNATVLVRDMMIGGPNRNALLNQRRLEPGQRECTAVVIMPSFVPYATLETASTWFKLSNPKHKDMTSVDAIKLSGRVRAIENCAFRVSDANCYREGELGRLLSRVKQLETRLPLQSAKVQIPYENTLGGFAMFNTGITDLAPELYGWYGAPGINIDAETTLFLVGNHFSVHQTRIIAGGRDIPSGKTEMLSRQVMKVTIPKGALRLQENIGAFADAGLCPNPKNDCKEPGSTENICWPHNCCAKNFVQIHVATPYGVTAPVLVPAEVVCPPACTPCTPTTPPKETPPPEQIGNAPCAKYECPTYKCPIRCPDDSEEQAKKLKEFQAQQAIAKKRVQDEDTRVKNLQDAARAQTLADAIAIANANKQKAADDLKQYKDALDRIEKKLNEKKASTGGSDTSHQWTDRTAEQIVAVPSALAPPSPSRDSVPLQPLQVQPSLPHNLGSRIIRNN